jgi:hypothetical protein
MCRAERSLGRWHLWLRYIVSPARSSSHHIIMNFEAESEAIPFTPEQDAEMLALALAEAPAALAAVSAAEDKRALFYAAPNGAMAAYLLRDFAQARVLAEQCLTLAAEFPDDWNYGNAIHYAHIVLGLLALEEGSIPRAEAALLAAGATPGSPQLASFGPSMFLALKLLQAGEPSAVLEYFQLCRKFWTMGGAWLNIWEEKVRGGGIPNFFFTRYR